jgi:hypothetical protein
VGKAGFTWSPWRQATCSQDSQLAMNELELSSGAMLCVASWVSSRSTKVK